MTLVNYLKFHYFAAYQSFMRQTLLSLFFIVLFNNLQAQDIINQFLGKDQFPNKYIQANKIVKETGWEYKITRKGIADSTLLGYYIYKYNNDGEMIEENIFDNKNYQTFKMEYTYNVLGSVIQKVINNYSKEIIFPNLPLKGYKYTYDSVGRIASKVSYNGETMLINTEQRNYDKNGNLYKIDYKPYNGAGYVLNEATYDDDHNITNIDYLYLGHKLEYSHGFKTDSTATGDKIISIDKDGEPLCVYRFNKYEQFIEWTSFTTVGLSKITFVEKITYYPDGTPYSYTRYNNGKMDRMIKYYYEK